MAWWVNTSFNQCTRIYFPIICHVLQWWLLLFLVCPAGLQNADCGLLRSWKPIRWFQPKVGEQPETSWWETSWTLTSQDGPQNPKQDRNNLLIKTILPVCCRGRKRHTYHFMEWFTWIWCRCCTLEYGEYTGCTESIHFMSLIYWIRRVNISHVHMKSIMHQIKIRNDIVWHNWKAKIWLKAKWLWKFVFFSLICFKFLKKQNLKPPVVNHFIP